MDFVLGLLYFMYFCNTMKHYLSFIIISIILLAGCVRDRALIPILDTAEELMQARPDSSFALLEPIDIESISSRENKARYALLYAQTRDKNYIDDTTDALINVAVDYYARHDDYERRFLSLYYQGRVYENAAEFNKAMLSFTKAEEMIDQVDDDRTKGMLYVHMGQLYINVYNWPRALDSFKKSEQFYIKSGSVLQHYSRLSIAACYANMNQYEKSVTIAKEVLDWAIANNETRLIKNCKEKLGAIYMSYAYPQAYFELFPEIEDSNPFRNHYILALNYAEKQDELNALEHLDSAWRYTADIQDTINLKNCTYYVHKRFGNYEEAMIVYEELMHKQDSILRYTMTQPFITVQRDFFQSQAENNELKLQQVRQRQISIAIISLLIIVFISFYLRQRLAAKDNEISRYMELAQGLENTLIENKAAVGKMESEMDKMNQQINSLFAGQFSLIDKLSVTYYETHGSRRDKEEIYTKVRKEIEQLSTDKKFLAQLEETVNKYKGNVMRIVRESMPQFSEMDFRLLCFMYAGFSAKAISVFTNDSIANIYKKKSRFKDRIAESEAADKEVLLDYLS